MQTRMLDISGYLDANLEMQVGSKQNRWSNVSHMLFLTRSREDLVFPNRTLLKIYKYNMMRGTSSISDVLI